MQSDAALPDISVQRLPVVAACVAADGSASHPAFRRMSSGDASIRDLADAVHLICMLHGAHPGILDRAAQHPHDPPSAQWLAAALATFAGERQRLARAVAIAGPLPSTPGQVETQAAILSQRHALDTLGRSDRAGCALGAAIALALDWTAMGTFLDLAAARMGDPVTPHAFPDNAATLALLETVRTPAIERAMLFGAQQLVAQHRGLWDLIDARAEARRHS